MDDIIERLIDAQVTVAARACDTLDTDVYDALGDAVDEIKRLSKYETTVKRIAWDYIELSHDKAYNQRDEYIRWCRATIQEDKGHHD